MIFQHWAHAAVNRVKGRLCLQHNVSNGIATKICYTYTEQNFISKDLEKDAAFMGDS